MAMDRIASNNQAEGAVQAEGVVRVAGSGMGGRVRMRGSDGYGQDCQ